MAFIRPSADAVDFTWVGDPAYARPAADAVGFVWNGADYGYDYLRPYTYRADADFSIQTAYTRPTYDSADASFASGVYQVYLGSAPLTGVYLGATPVQVYFGSTQVFG